MLSLNGETIHVEWDSPTAKSQGGKITSYRLIYEDTSLSDGETHVITLESNYKDYVITGLRQHAQYQVQVAAVTETGVGLPSDPILVHTQENRFGMCSIDE